MSHNDVWTHSIQYSGVAAPINDAQQDPLFLDWPNDDFHLQSNSPAIDAGVDVSITTDLDGDPRPIGLPDIGMDEYVQWVYLPYVLRNY